MADSKEAKTSVASSEEAAKAARQGVGSQAGLKAGESHQPPAVQSTTEKTPAEADKTSVPNALDAKPEQPPVRASKPDTPIAQTLVAGAGEHTPADPNVYDPEGRPWGSRPH